MHPKIIHKNSVFIELFIVLNDEFSEIKHFFPNDSEIKKTAKQGGQNR